MLVNSAVFRGCACFRVCVWVIGLWAMLSLPQAEARTAKKVAPSSAQRAELSPKQAMSEHTDDLRALMLQLYTEHPEELAKSTQVGPREMTEWVFDGKANWKFEAIRRLQGMTAIDLAFDEAFGGDRILALVVGIETLLFEGYGSQNEFEIPPQRDRQKLQQLQQQLKDLQARLQRAPLPSLLEQPAVRQPIEATLKQLLQRLSV
ncbi:hypothetical protein INP77_13250 [Methylophilus sp. 13]|jgi:uncharacterized membrane protein YccC|uniref:hypothetical protein n=1 Tax=Methylophilus sp. 13 TaxID=2781018 RepID=UPI001890B5D0|nr:hypothetical protein [Methylophilus sp. 13]MBF5040460.1 hypothetical protein [Methylophilus sp. 13]